MLIAPIWLKIRTYTDFKFQKHVPWSDSERISMTGSAVLIQYTHVTDVTDYIRNFRGIYALQHRPTVASKKSNAINFIKASRDAGRLFETARLRRTKSSLV